MKRIESASNAWLKQIKKLELKKYRDNQNEYIIDGEHLVEEALTYDIKLKWILTTDDGLETYSHLIAQVAEEKIVILTPELLKQLSTLKTPQNIMAIVEKENDFELSKDKHILVLDQVQDPGNLGTMIRTADAAGFGGVILSKGCTDLYSEKAQRAMQGSQFHLPIMTDVVLSEWIEKAKAEGIIVAATALDESAETYKKLESKNQTAIVMGNEGQGVSREVLDLATKKVYIPMKGNSESLNVAVAAGIIMFHF